ncbi:hypothetical protein [Streptomyces sp. NPDC057494]
MTGATGGIGRVTVFRLAGAGWDVIAGTRDEEKARALLLPEMAARGGGGS